MALHWKKPEADDTPTCSITYMNYTDDIALLVSTPALEESLMHSLKRAAGIAVFAKYLFICFVGFARSFVSRVILLTVCTIRFLHANIFYMVWVLLTVLSTCVIL